MRFVVCKACSKGYCVCGNRDEVSALLSAPEWRGGFPCITPLCAGRMQATALPQGLCSYEEVPLSAFYRAINGFGGASGAPASLRKVKQALTTKQVVAVVGEATGNPERSIIRQLVLSDGTRLHFDASSKGACLYYMEEPGPSCLEVVENELRSERGAEGSDTDREETGRGDEDGLEEL